MQPKTAFISYKWESDEQNLWVENLAKDLRQNGIDALLDKWEVGLGESFVEYMESKIPDADYFLFIVSSGSINAIESSPNKGGAVKFEVQLARAQMLHGDDLKFIPIIYNDKDSYPKRLRGIRYANFSDQSKYKDNLTALINAIKGHSSKPPIIGIGKLQYESKTYHMLPAADGAPMRSFMETFEPYVGFPFYSYASDHQSYWPIRMSEDREFRFSKIIAFVRNPEFRKHIIRLVNASNDNIQIFGNNTDDFDDGAYDEQLYTKLRMNIKDGTNEAGQKLLEEHPVLFDEYMRLERHFWNVKKAMPNLIFKLKLKHDRNVLLKNCFVSLSVLGELYDIMLDNMRIITNEELRNYTPGTKLNIKLGDLDPDMEVTLKVWYNYIPMADRFDPKPVHFQFEKTKGILLHALSADGVTVEKTEQLIQDEGVYNPCLDTLDINN